MHGCPIYVFHQLPPGSLPVATDQCLRFETSSWTCQSSPSFTHGEIEQGTRSLLTVSRPSAFKVVLVADAVSAPDTLPVLPSVVSAYEDSSLPALWINSRMYYRHDSVTSANASAQRCKMRPPNWRTLPNIRCIPFHGNVACIPLIDSVISTTRMQGGSCQAGSRAGRVPPLM